MGFGVGCGLLPSFFMFQNSSLYQDFVEVVDCNEMEVSADPPCCESWEPYTSEGVEGVVCEDGASCTYEDGADVHSIS